jgi:hypothetical protein
MKSNILRRLIWDPNDIMYEKVPNKNALVSCINGLDFADFKNLKIFKNLKNLNNLQSQSSY